MCILMQSEKEPPHFAPRTEAWMAFLWRYWAYDPGAGGPRVQRKVTMASTGFWINRKWECLQYFTIIYKYLKRFSVFTGISHEIALVPWFSGKYRKTCWIWENKYIWTHIHPLRAVVRMKHPAPFQPSSRTYFLNFWSSCGS